MGIRVVISELLFSNKIFSKMYIMGTRVPRLVTQGLRGYSSVKGKKKSMFFCCIFRKFMMCRINFYKYFFGSKYLTPSFEGRYIKRAVRTKALLRQESPQWGIRRLDLGKNVHRLFITVATRLYRVITVCFETLV